MRFVWRMLSHMLFTIFVLACQSIKVQSNTGNFNNENRFVIRDAPVIPSPYSSNQRSLPAVKVDPKGTVYTTEILKQQLANELNLPLRDLRIVDPSFPSQIQATFTARPNAILFTLENIKVVVKHNEALVFSPFQSEVREFIPALQQQIITAYKEQGAAGGPGGTGEVMRFEHIVIEAALNVVCNNLFRKVRALSPAIASALRGLQAESRGLDIIQTQVDELLPLKNKLDELKKRVKEISRAISDVLDNDEAMEMMYLDGLPTSKPARGVGGVTSAGGVSSGVGDGAGVGVEVDTDTVAEAAERIAEAAEAARREQEEEDATISLEMMLENYLNEIGWIASEIEENLDTIINTEENVVLQLDLLRNRILRFELSLSISSFIIGCAALVTGLFGMNLLSHVENSPYLFWLVTGTLSVGMLGTWTTFKRFGKSERLF